MARGPEEDASPAGGPGPRLGVLGGTFDPPHVGHVSVARELADALDLDEVLWVTSYDPPHKDTSAVTPFAIRAEMARAAVESDPRFRAAALEEELPTPSYTVRTLEALAAGRPGARLFLVLGADQYRQIDTWWRADELPRLATLVVVDRGGDPAGGGASAASAGPPARFVPVTPVDVSSSEIRARVSRGDPVDALVPGAVLDVILREGLYLSTS